MKTDQELFITAGNNNIMSSLMSTKLCKVIPDRKFKMTMILCPKDENKRVYKILPPKLWKFELSQSIKLPTSDNIFVREERQPNKIARQEKDVQQ